MEKAEHDKFIADLKIGFDIAYKRLIEYKKYKKSKLVVMRNDKIVWLTPEEAAAEINYKLE